MEQSASLDIDQKILILDPKFFGQKRRVTGHKFRMA